MMTSNNKLCILQLNTEPDSCKHIHACKWGFYKSSCGTLASLLQPPLRNFAVVPVIVVRPSVTEPLTEGVTVMLACTALGVPSIQWYKDGLLLMNESLIAIYNEEFENSDLLFTMSILELCSVGGDDEGTYSCQATNSAGNTSVEFEVQVMLGMFV